MVIKCKIQFKDYIKLQYELTYRNFWFIFITITGLMMLLRASIELIRETPDNDNLYFQLLLGIWILCLPLLIYWRSKKNFNSNQLIKEEITYGLSTDKFSVSTSFSNSEIPWDKLYKVRELKGWFLIYSSAKIAHPIPKNCMNPAEIAEARYIFKQLKGPKLVLKN